MAKAKLTKSVYLNDKLAMAVEEAHNIIYQDLLEMKRLGVIKKNVRLKEHDILLLLIILGLEQARTIKYTKTVELLKKWGNEQK